MVDRYSKAKAVKWYIYRRYSPDKWVKYRGPYETAEEARDSLRRIRRGTLTTPPHAFSVFKVTEEQILSIK